MPVRAHGRGALAAWCFDLTWPLFALACRQPLGAVVVAGSALVRVAAGAARRVLAAAAARRARQAAGRAAVAAAAVAATRDLPAPGEAELVVIDVGQGLSVLVRTARPQPAVRHGAGACRTASMPANASVVPTLRALGVRQLDVAVVSHGDNDHAGGFAGGARAHSRCRSPWRPKGSGVAGHAVPAAPGMHWHWDGVRFRFLHPPPYFPYLDNESSCVLRIETAHGAALLTGDIGEVIERDLVRRDRRGAARRRGAGRRTTAAAGLPIRRSSPRPAHSWRWCPPATATASTIRSPTVVRALARGRAPTSRTPRDAGALRVRLQAGGITRWKRDGSRIRGRGTRCNGSAGWRARALRYPIGLIEAAMGRRIARAGTGQGRRLADDAAVAAVGGRAGDHRRAFLEPAAQGRAAAGPGRRSARLGRARQARSGAHRIAAPELAAGRAAGRGAGRAQPPARADPRAHRGRRPPSRAPDGALPQHARHHRRGGPAAGPVRHRGRHDPDVPRASSTTASAT